MKKKWILTLALAAVLAVTAACGGKKADETAEGGKETPSDASSESGEYESRVTKLGNYKGVQAEAVSLEVTEEEIQAEIDALLNFYPDTKPVEGKTVVEEGDIVNIDFTGRMDGELFAGGSSEGRGYILTIGSHSFIEGFEEGLIGKETGTICELNLTFPEPYNPNPDFSGKEVVFEVEIHDIVEYVDAQWTDEFVQKNTEYDSIEAYREGTKKTLETEKIQNQPSMWQQKVIQAVIDESEFDCKESEIEALKSNIIQEYQMYAAFSGVELAEFLQYYMGGISEAEFEQQAAEQAENQLKGQLVIDAIREAENISLTEEEYQESLKELADQYGAESPEAFETQYGRETIENNLLYDKTIAFVVDQAVEI